LEKGFFLQQTLKKGIGKVIYHNPEADEMQYVGRRFVAMIFRMTMEAFAVQPNRPDFGSPETPFLGAQSTLHAFHEVYYTDRQGSGHTVIHILLLFGDACLTDDLLHRNPLKEGPTQ
jgi:hypothetical protein